MIGKWSRHRWHRQVQCCQMCHEPSIASWLWPFSPSLRICSNFFCCLTRRESRVTVKSQQCYAPYSWLLIWWNASDENFENTVDTYKEYISSISIISIQVSTPTFQAQRQPNHWFFALLARSPERKLSSGTQPSKKTGPEAIYRLISQGPCNILQHLAQHFPRNCAAKTFAKTFAKTNCRLIPDLWSFNI